MKIQVLTVGLLSRRTMGLWSTFGFPIPNFDGEFEHGFGSVGSGRVSELRARVSLGPYIVIAGSPEKSDRMLCYELNFGSYGTFHVICEICVASCGF